MSKSRYIIQWFPSIIEEELNEVTIKKRMTTKELEELRREIGIWLFGELYNIEGDNSQMPAMAAGIFGSTVKEYKKLLEEDVIIKKETI